MSSVQHSPLSPLFCPFHRLHCLFDPYNELTIINISCYLPNVEGHHLYPLYWCNNKESGDESLCHACTFKGIGTTYYFCHECEVSFHKECVESPPLIKSIYHSKHPLQLVQDESAGIYCSHCESRSSYQDAKLYYYCFTCKFSLHPVCATTPSFLNFPKRHEHDLNFFPRKADLTCDVCGVVDSKPLIYVCLQCDFVVHKNCIYLPFVIRISRHDHRLSFAYSISRILSCGVCRQKVDENYGSYSCTKDCSYTVHSRCATREDVWDGKELEEEPEEDYENLNSFEVVGDGIIQHFSHSHHMKFEKKTTENLYDDDEKRCQACILPVYGGGVYRCMKSNCDFVLHEACANLPRTKQHIAHPNPFILQVSDTKNIFLCEYCQRCLYGFRYVCSKGDESISIDVRCAAISEPFVQQCHPHPLFLSNELGKSRPCSICKNEKVQTLNCIECIFFLCFYCATLPYKVRYEHDEHFLTLSYKENESLNWCEICEEIMDSTIWLYTCHECGTVFHIPCLLGKCPPYVKPAQNLSLNGTKCNIVPNNRLTRLICYDCDGRCQDKLMLEFYDADGRNLFCYRHWEVVDLRDMVFDVTPFGPSCCEIQYTHPHIVKEEADADDAPTFSYDYCFLAEVTATNQKDDKMFLPVEAMRCGALNQQCKEVKLVNKEGKSWTARFGFSESDGAYYISRGWRKFCRDNKCTNGDLFVFNVVGDGTTTPLLCVCPERKECTELLIKHFSRIDGSIASTSRD